MPRSPSEDAQGITRRTVVRGAGQLALAVGLGSSARTLWQPDSASASAADDLASLLRYIELMDQVSAVINDRWSEPQRKYANVGSETLVNARMLFVHAISATIDHKGPSRQDERAAALARRLCESPAPFRLAGNSVTQRDKMFHAPGWTGSLTYADAVMDKAIDPQVAEALAAAHRVGDRLGLSEEDRQLIVKRISETARGSFFRYPNMRLNQINWNSQLYALDHRLTGNPELLQVDYRKHLLRFAQNSVRPAKAGGSPNLGPGYHFVYIPRFPPESGVNFDSAEYANETIDVLRHYRGALAAGMQPLPGDAIRVLRAYLRRTLYGDWTHSGYLNWDTGLNERRRYIGKTWAFAQQGLLAMIVAEDFRTPEMAMHARLFFDRGLKLYLRWARADPTGLAPQTQFGSRDHRQAFSSRYIYAARMASNAAQALALGIAATPSQVPPSIYSFDPDTQRLAISTRQYSTAILVHNRRATDYGGLDPNRLFDVRQRPIGSIGGGGRTNFSAKVLSASGRLLVSSQRSDPSRASMQVEVRKRGGGRHRYGPGSAAYPRKPYAGPMDSVHTRGKVAAGRARIVTRHAFLATHIDLHWELAVPDGGRWEVRLPTFGGDTKVIVERAGGRDRLGSGRIALAGVRQAIVEAADGGYTVKPRGIPRGARLRAVRPGRARGAPDPGPTITLEGRVGHARTVRIALRIQVMYRA